LAGGYFAASNGNVTDVVSIEYIIFRWMAFRLR